MSKFNLKGFLGSIFSTGKQYAPEIMTGGSIVLGWIGVYIFWKQSRKAEKRIQEEENKLNSDESGVILDIPDEEKQKLPVKDKVVIYLQYCYLSLILGLASSGLSIWANRIQAGRILELMALTKLITDKNTEKKEYVSNLEKEVGGKKVEELRKEMYHEHCSTDDILSMMQDMMANGDTRTIFIDTFTGNIFPEDTLTVTKAIAEVNETLRLNRMSALKERTGDAFYAADSLPWGLNEDSFGDVFSSVDLGSFLARMGEVSKQTNCRIGELMEFRYYGGSDPLKQSDILEYDTTYRDILGSDEITPAVCFIDYTDALSPTFESMERNRL